MSDNDKILEVNDILIKKPFLKEFLDIEIDGQNYYIEVYNTGSEYIPVDERFILSDKIKQELRKKYENNRLEKLAEAYEMGNFSIHLSEEDKEKLEKFIAGNNNRSNNGVSLKR